MRAVVELALDETGLTVERRWVWIGSCPVWRGYNPDEPRRAAAEEAFSQLHDVADRCRCGGLMCECGAHYPPEFLAELPHAVG